MAHKDIMVSFATRPSQGGEGGVGWAFVRAASELAVATRTPLEIIVDARDLVEVQRALERNLDYVALTPVALPRVAQAKFGNARTRGSYLAWLPAARSAVAAAVPASGTSILHQVTFATATLPPAFPRKRNDVTELWGPITVAGKAVAAQHRRATLRENLGVRTARAIATSLARRPSRVIVTNQRSQRLLRRSGVEAAVEPNVIAEPRTRAFGREQRIVIAGLLIDRKRPWLAVQAMQSSVLQQHTLDIVGDGPLRPSLESYVRQERLDGRIRFHGRVDRQTAMNIMERSSALAHPAIREGSPWVVGEAAAGGVASVVFDDSGSETVARMSDNGSEVCAPDASVEDFARRLASVAALPPPAPSGRWSASRLPRLLADWRALDPARTTETGIA